MAAPKEHTKMKFSYMEWFLNYHTGGTVLSVLEEKEETFAVVSRQP